MLGQERTFLAELMRQDMWGSMDSNFFSQVISSPLNLLYSYTEPSGILHCSDLWRCEPVFGKSQPS